MPGRGGGRGGARGRGGHRPYRPAHDITIGSPEEEDTSPKKKQPQSWSVLEKTLDNIDNGQYPEYKRLKKRFENEGPPGFALCFDYIQTDPYAAPSRARIFIPWANTKLSEHYKQSPISQIALCDYITRKCAEIIRSKHMDKGVKGGHGGHGWGGPKGGAFNINAPGQEILPRSSVIVNDDGDLEIRFTIALPAAGRRILGGVAKQILAVDLVDLVQRSVVHENINPVKLHEHVASMETQSALRQRVVDAGFVTFIANGSILPRASGANAAPMKSKHVVPFVSPEELEISFVMDDGTKITGMGIPRGVTMLTGGGFHGKSTLLQAIELGVYNHVPGDGRELIVTDPTAAKIRVEDGRSVRGVDISPYINNLPGSKDTKKFFTDDASGSTSMAASIQEALEVVSRTLLIDEDSSATNLLVRDQRMRHLLQHEPITPLIEKVRALYNEHGVSTVIVIGGLGDWLNVADNVIAMESYVPKCLNSATKSLNAKYPVTVTESSVYGPIFQRNIKADLTGWSNPYPTRKNFITIKPISRNPVENPAEEESGIDLRTFDQLVETGQSRMISEAIDTIERLTCDQGPMPMNMALEGVFRDTTRPLPTNITDGKLVAARSIEIAAALSRMRMGLTVASHDMVDQVMKKG
ncbi:hypothetical protein K470DRAFT_263108 [Piedraia hortae CBS 480.64]|uniref:ABC transporter ATPase n=1 Tax=Piedraia hortae CBS 480.64 TaxID=1314780 RepID=A0A6A7C3V8_9PEZI|nr:hypothetical protein K470DRAFT_263108 [Piedraia hortae CBS 480.64]